MKEIALHNVLPLVFAETEGYDASGSDVWQKDLIFEKEKIYLIEANSGTGKSSLCSYIYGYRKDYEGEILFDGKDIKLMSTNDIVQIRQKSLSLLWQELRLFPELTAMENVVIKNDLTKFQSQQQIDTWFEMLGIADRKNYKIGHMSFGQQQRVAMIRSLCQPFDFIFVDEPVSHLDDTNSKIMGDIMVEEARRQGAGVIVTSIGKHMNLDYTKKMKL